MMLKRFLPLLLLAVVPLVLSCGGDDPAGPDEPDEPVKLKMVDPDATPATKALYSNLWAVRD